MKPVNSFLYNHFVAPRAESIFVPKSLLFWGLNVLTLGVFGAAETVVKHHRVKQLNLIHKDLESQVETLMTRWDEMDKQLTAVMGDLKSARGDDVDNDMDERIDNISNEVNKLDAWTFTVKKGKVSFSEMALGTISFVGQLIANILSLGVYGVIQNQKSKNEMTLLEAKNTFIKGEGFEKERTAQADQLKKKIQNAREYLDAKTAYNGIKTTDAGKAYLALQKAKQDLVILQKDQKTLQADFDAMKVDNAAVKKAKTIVDNELALKKQEIIKLEGQVLGQYQLQKDLKTAEKNLADIQAKLKLANVKADKVNALEKEIANIQAKQKNQPEIVKLAPEVGPIAPKYTPRKEDKTVDGAMDMNDDNRDSFAAKADFFDEYNQRYGDKKSASEMIAEGFNHAYTKLIDMAEKGDKIKLNKSGNTAAKPAVYAIYRYMILDLINGAKLDINGCHGYQLMINSSVSMLPSQPEKILQYKDDQMGGQKPIVSVHYKQRDDFTPDEEALGLRDGVNPVAVKWILEQLTDQEKMYLFTHLMEPVIENKHPDYQKIVAFMKNKNDPRVKLVQTASDLIQDMATAIQKKFGQNVLTKCWQTADVDWDIEPFVKPDDKIDGLDKILADDIIKTGTKVVDWELDADVIGAKNNWGQLQQKEFYDLILAAKTKNQTIFAAFDHHNLLEFPEKPNQKFKKLTLADVSKQFHVSHEMIGQDPTTFTGGERCLFSNLLAVLVSDKKDLTSENVHKLKRAMAAYLDKIYQASLRWNIEKTKPEQLQSKDAPKLKEMAELQKEFQHAILKTHGCTVPNYMRWLRNEMGWGVPKIDLDSLTSFEIQLAAYTMGVRIGLVPIDYEALTSTDKHGRILPEAEVYGPNTKEMLLMGMHHFAGSTKPGSYYGLFPRLNVGKDENQYGGDIYTYYAAKDLKKYWKEIQQYKSNAELKKT